MFGCHVGDILTVCDPEGHKHLYWLLSLLGASAFTFSGVGISYGDDGCERLADSASRNFSFSGCFKA